MLLPIIDIIKISIRLLSKNQLKELCLSNKMRLSSEELKHFYENYQKPKNPDGTLKLTKNYTVEELSDYRRIYNHKWRLKEENKEKAKTLALAWYHRLENGGAYQKQIRMNKKKLI